MGIGLMAERPASHSDAGIVADTRHSKHTINTISLRRRTASIGLSQMGHFGNCGSGILQRTSNTEHEHT